MKTFSKLLLFFLILFIGFVGLAFYWTFYKPLPNYESNIALNQLQQPVTIHWDEFGVPHIYSKNQADLYFALGYVHAQDRLWQMTLSQIAAEGRFAEFFGEDLIELDKYQRTLGFWKIAQRLEKEALNNEERDILQSYSDGVNSFIDENSNKLPIEFALTGIEPIRWNPTRSLAIVRLMAWDLNLSWWTELTYSYLKANLPADKFEELALRVPEDSPTTLDDNESIKLTAAMFPMLEQEMSRRKLMQSEGTHVGSNAWVVDASKTTTGYPLLAGDPHLGLDMPGKWYEVHLNISGKNVSGATIAGVPGVVLGQNDEMAWSFTNIMADDTDFFLEKTDPEDRGRYVTDSLQMGTIAYQPFMKSREIIKVKGKDDEVLEIRYTKHGPVISDIYPNVKLSDEQVIAMRWTGQDVTNEFRALYQINWAENFQDFKDALPHFGVPGQNFMYADIEGNIAMFSTGHLPIRSGNKILVRKGWDPSQDWQGYIPNEEMPHVINPDKGWIANANNKLTTDNYKYYIASFWEPPSRIERISEFLIQHDKLTPELFAELQNDSYSKFAEEVVPIVLDVIASQQIYNFDDAVSYLANWDFKYQKNATAASIFDVFILKLTENTLLDEFGDEVYQNFIHHENIPIRTITELLQDSSAFFDNVATSEVETKADIVLKSMQDALLFLSDSLGQEPLEWRWEQLHTITFEPPLFAQAAQDSNASASLKLIVDNLMSTGTFPVVGHGMSVNNGQYSWEKPYKMVLGASIRRIVDLSDLSSTQSVIPTGQSASPLSDHFGDQTELWLNGQYRTFYQDSAFFNNTKMKSMKLVPKE